MTLKDVIWFQLLRKSHFQVKYWGQVNCLHRIKIKYWKVRQLPKVDFKLKFLLTELGSLLARAAKFPSSPSNKVIDAFSYL